MSVEELAEWIEANRDGDITGADDSLADCQYLLLGDAVASGMPAEPLLDEMHRSNMTKVATNQKTGKGTKTSNYSPPNLEAILSRNES